MRYDDLRVLLEQRDISIDELFVAGGEVFASKDSGDFRSSSIYGKLELTSAAEEQACVDLLRRLGTPEYSSLGEVDSEIAQVREWEYLYDELLRVLEGYGKNDGLGDGEFYLVDDYYGSPQHKIECARIDLFTLSLVSDVQSALKQFRRRWEVIFALPAEAGHDHAFTVYADAVIEHRE
jgi:hypothetical protein